MSATPLTDAEHERYKREGLQVVCVTFARKLELMLIELARAAKAHAGPISDCCMTGEATGELCELHQTLASLQDEKSVEQESLIQELKAIASKAQDSDAFHRAAWLEEKKKAEQAEQQVLVFVETMQKLFKSGAIHCDCGEDGRHASHCSYQRASNTLSTTAPIAGRWVPLNDVKPLLEFAYIHGDPDCWNEFIAKHADKLKGQTP